MGRNAAIAENAESSREKRSFPNKLLSKLLNTL
uniref:Uncharacterized protein n=2 Tax=unclassified Caudoviricetes TaxID=2788787 RepID=A0A8S5UUE0_9CAUD|nr:MAG TPA: hypothetical protein [Myoviridae sp. ctGgs6]DAF98018.1 MAG TPA: hypothetical protein [Myoviridae sp. ctUKl33]DAN02443.1 MAG TPA: hypothetical protein [Caudoviricetes sp.]